MDKSEVMAFLKSKGSEQTRKIFTNHGANCDFYGVKVADLKIVQKKVKVNHELATELYDTKNADAQYLAGLIADPKKFTRAQFDKWANNASWYMVSEYALAWNLAESPLCMEICRDWIHDSDEQKRAIAWAAMSSYLGITPNDEIDNKYHKELIKRVVDTIHDEPADRVRYCMNGYLIALGGAIPELTNACKEAGDRIGKVEVYMGKTACKVPVVRPYIEKMEDKGRIGKKKKTCKC